MKFDLPQQRGTLIRRYKRFLADVRLDDGTELTVHCPNSGAMTTCSEPGRPVIISDSENPKRKLRHTLEMIHMGDAWVGVNTNNPNRAVAELIKAGEIPELTGYSSLKREVRYGREGKSRIDILLEEPGRPDCWVEVKNTTLRRGEHAAFPDAVTTRGRKHLEELIDVTEQGDRAVMFFFVGREDCLRMRPADEVDPDYGATLRRAADAGVELLAYRVSFSPEGIRLVAAAPVDLDPSSWNNHR